MVRAELGVWIFPETSKESLWTSPVQSLWEETFFLLPQVVSFTEMYKIFSELTDQIDQAGLTDEQRERDTEAKLSELRALSIVADDWGRKSVNQGRTPFMPLNGLHSFQAPSPGFKQTESDYQLVCLVASSALIHLSCLRLSVSPSNSNATLTKPSAKCNVKSQYVFFSW